MGQAAVDIATWSVRLNVLLVLAISIAFGEGPKVVVSTSQQVGGKQIAGELVSLTSKQAVIQSSGDQVSLDIDSVDAIQFDPSPVNSGPSTDSLLTLLDGTRIGIQGLASDGRTVAFETLHGKISIANNLIASVRLGELSAEQAAAWETFASAELSSDMLVLRRDGGQLSRIEGIILAISDRGVEFDFSGTTIDVPFEKLAGLRMYSAKQDEPLPILASVTYDNGQTLAAAALERSNSVIQVTVPCGAEFSLPLASLSRINFGSGRSIPLTKLEARYSAAKAPLGLAIAIDDDLLPRVTQETQARGEAVGEHVRFPGGGGASYRIPSGFRKLVGVLELRSKKAGTGCVVKIHVDNKEKSNTTLHPGDKAINFEVEVAADQRLQITVEPTSSIPTGAIVLVRSAVLLK